MYNKFPIANELDLKICDTHPIKHAFEANCLIKMRARNGSVTS